MTDVERDPGGEHERTSPLGLWMYADSYLDAANCVMTHSGHPHRAPVYFLYSHAIELAFKAFLRAKGCSINQCEAYGHRLGALLNACHANGLTEPPHLAKGLRDTLDQLDKGDPDTRYIRTGFKQRPDLLRLRLIAEWLLGAAEQFCVPAGASAPRQRPAEL